MIILFIMIMMITTIMMMVRNMLVPVGVTSQRQRAKFIVRIYRADGLPRCFINYDDDDYDDDDDDTLPHNVKTG